MAGPLHYASITALGARIRSGDLSPVEVTRAQLDRIDRLDPDLRTYATIMTEQALADATRAERDIEAGGYLGPLHGVPIAVKDLCATTGVRTMGGCAVNADNVPSFDATVVSRLRAAGAVILGKLNLTEGAMGGYNPKLQYPENPWGANRFPGASSSGSGAATAAGLAYGTLGSDTGGSIRYPAAACGVVGLKPTWGRVSRHGVMDLAASLDHVGPLTRSTRDAGIMLQAIAGHDPLDPTSLADPVPVLDSTDAALINSLQDIRLGFDETFATEDIADDFARALKASVDVFARLGAEIVSVRMPARLREYLAAWPVLCASEAAFAHRATYPSRADEYGPWFRQWLELGTSSTATDYAHANELRLACNGEIAAALANVDAFLLPGSPATAHRVSADSMWGPMPDDRDPWWSRFTVPFDYNGYPTLSLPCGLSAENLPYSVQLAARQLDEALLLRLGEAFEAVTSFHDDHPPGWD